MLPENLINIGFTTKPHGIDGTIVVKIEGNFEEDLLKREFLFLSIDETMIPFFIEEIRIFGDSAFLKLEGYDSEDEIKRLKSRKVYIESQASGNETDLTTLKGFRFRDDFSNREGIILDYEEYNENLVFKVESNQSEYLLPVSPDLIISVDTKNKFILLNLPEGIFDLDN